MIIASELIAIEKKELTSIEPSVVEIDCLEKESKSL